MAWLADAVKEMDSHSVPVHEKSGRDDVKKMKTTTRNASGKMTAKAAAILPAFLVAVSLSAAQPDGFNDGIDGDFAQALGMR